VEIKPPFQCDYGYPISVGARTFINYGAVILDVAQVTIGADVQIATGVQLLTPTHPLDAGTRRDGWESAEPISVEDGVWLGGGAIVCPGVTIGEDTVVGAGSVVTTDLPPRVLAVGNPCRPIRDL
jgi:maltose O-acetyltransferase